jgi:hypothetical protein
MNELVTIVHGEAVTDTLAIAEGSKNHHEAVIRLVRNYKNDLEEFGLLRFEIRPRLKGKHGGGNTEYALLNEHQATLLLTYMKNTEVIRRFKKALVQAFFQMAQMLQANQGARPASLLPIDREFRAALRLAKAIGLKGNMAVLSANQLIMRMTGTSCLRLLDSEQLVAQRKVQHFTPSELGLRYGGISGTAFNRLLAAHGFQEAEQCGKRNIWRPTELGRQYAVLIDTGKRHGNGAMIQQVRWYEDILDVVRKEEVRS